MKQKLEASETLTALLCDQTGKIAIHGSREDHRLLEIAIEQVKALERWRDKVNNTVGGR